MIKSSHPQIPTYLVRNPYSYCFRYQIPKDLQPLVGKKELRCSLKTGYLNDAKSKARFLAGQIQRIFKGLRTRGNEMAKLTPQQIQSVINTHIKDELQRYEDGRIQSVQGIFVEDFMSREKDLQEYIADSTMDLQQCHYANAAYTVNKLLEKLQIHLDPDSMEYKLLCRELLKAQIKMYQVEINRNAGDYPGRGAWDQAICMPPHI